MIPKFRAWSKKFKRMYEVTLIDYENGDVGLKDDHGGVAIGDIKQLILMQSTGMFDKNGVEIWEGDIVLTTRLIDYTYKNFKGVVKMLEGC
ncbi:TPA: YopX family protein, partial [Streptococcus agalactiae]